MRQALIGKADRKGKVLSVSDAMLLQDEQQWFHLFMFKDGELGEVLKKLGAVSLEGLWCGSLPQYPKKDPLLTVGL